MSAAAAPSAPHPPPWSAASAGSSPPGHPDGWESARTSGPGDPVGLLDQKLLQRLFHSAPHHLVHVGRTLSVSTSTAAFRPPAGRSPAPPAPWGTPLLNLSFEKRFTQIHLPAREPFLQMCATIRTLSTAADRRRHTAPPAQHIVVQVRARVDAGGRMPQFAHLIQLL